MNFLCQPNSTYLYADISATEVLWYSEKLCRKLINNMENVNHEDLKPNPCSAVKSIWGLWAEPYFSAQPIAQACLDDKMRQSYLYLDDLQ